MMKKLLLLAFVLASCALAENITFWQVQKVKSNDALNIRAESTYKSSKLSSIPFNAQCVKSHGCGKDIDLEAMMHMQEDEVKAFLAQAKEGWCFIEYKDTKGWVNQKYLKKSSNKCN